MSATAAVGAADNSRITCASAEGDGLHCSACLSRTAAVRAGDGQHDGFERDFGRAESVGRP